MDPTGPSQPTLNDAYNTAGNPVDQDPQEQRTASAKSSSNSGSIVQKRETGDIPVPSSHDPEATPSSLAYGARDASGDDNSPAPPSDPNLEGEQMCAPGEGDVFAAQTHKQGFGEQKDLASDLDAKKEEQKGRREEVMRQRKEEVDIGGALGGRSGVAVVGGTNPGTDGN